MRGGHGGFYSSQDSDSLGEEGKFYTFTRDEIIELLGPKAGSRFASHYGMTEGGNFEGVNILHLLAHEEETEADKALCENVFKYRKTRYRLHTDDKVLTAWNAMTVWALAGLYSTSGEQKYLEAGKRSLRFLLDKSSNDGDYMPLIVSWRDGKGSGSGFLNDYAWMVCALLGMYEATGDDDYLVKAERFMLRAMDLFFDKEHGGFFLSGKDNEALFLNPKETYDGAVPSGNSVMAYNLVKLMHYSRSRQANADQFETAAEKQMAFLAAASAKYPSGHCFYLLALSLWMDASPLYICGSGGCAVAAGRRTDYDRGRSKEESDEKNV
jgi:uncharacterized protein YyaL (SSP411 family)